MPEVSDRIAPSCEKSTTMFWQYKSMTLLDVVRNWQVDSFAPVLVLVRISPVRPSSPAFTPPKREQASGGNRCDPRVGCAARNRGLR